MWSPITRIRNRSRILCPRSVEWRSALSTG
jgi:hypothetical protein